jgi:DNA-binding CsgD family transcriptional regulator
MTESVHPDDTLLAESLQAAGIAVCVKDTERRVLVQNNLCRYVCGDRSGRICDEGCMALYAAERGQQWRDWGPRVYRNSLIHDTFHDVTLLCSTRRIISFLQPLRDKYAMALEYFRDKGLTRREIDVMALTIQGVRNRDICDRLAISRSTLRTHLNNVYRKFRDLGELPEFIPANRLPG